MYMYYVLSFLGFEKIQMLTMIDFSEKNKLKNV